MKTNRLLAIFFAFTLCCLLTLPFFQTLSKANTLGPAYLFFERMQVDSPTEMILLFTPGTDFQSVEYGRVLKIIFPGNAGDWCKSQAAINVNGVSSSAIDITDWSIDQAAPGTLTGFCFQSASGDYIEIEGLGNLSSSISYGLQIESNPVVFGTALTPGEYLVSAQLTEGTKIENISFKINLLVSDEILVSALVSDTVSINCTLEKGSVSFGTLYKTGSYITSSLNITTESTSNFYWAVYGQNGGLFNSSGSTYLLPSIGVEGRVNLLTGEGFGMVVNTSMGTVEADFITDTPGVFGGIGQGSEEAKLFLYSNTTEETVVSQVTYGVRAGLAALTGEYNETVTYICGGYVGQGAF